MVTLDKNEPMLLILKIQNLYIARLLFIKNGNKTSIKPIQKSDSTSLELNIKKVTHWGQVGGMREP